MGRKESIKNPDLEFENSGNTFSFKKTAAAGAIILIPFLASFIFIRWIFDIFNGLPGHKIFQITSSPLINQFSKALAISTILIISMMGIGRLASTRNGKRVEEKLDSAIKNIPVLGTVYSVTKTAADTVFLKSEEFQHPVKLSHQGLTLTGFQTGNCSKDGKKVVFVPTSPNITSGFVIEVDENRVEEADESLEKAFTRVLSAGFSN